MELIDRRPLIEKLKNAIALGHKIETFVGELEAVLEDVENMPTIEAPQWIPCSERLPSEYDEFLITWTASATNEPLLAFAEYEPDAFLVSGGKWHLEDDMREFKDVDVIAWMPLPKPYEETDHEQRTDLQG